MKTEHRIYCQSRVGGAPAPDCLRAWTISPDDATAQTYYRAVHKRGYLKFIGGWHIEGSYATCPNCIRIEKAMTARDSAWQRRENRERRNQDVSTK